MAEQYASFQSQGPNVDVNLFTNAMNAGINAGNAQKTTLQAIVGGVKDAVGIASSVVGLVGGVQGLEAGSLANEAAAASNAVNASPEGIASRQQILTAQGNAAERADYLGGLQDQVTKDNEQIVKETAVDNLQIAAQTAQQTLGDIKNGRIVQAAISSGLPGNIESVLRDPEAVASISRNDKLSSQLVGILGNPNSGVDPQLAASTIRQFDAVQIQKQRMSMLQDQAKHDQDQVQKSQDSITEATGIMSTFPKYSEKVANGTLVPSKLQLVPTKDLTFKNGEVVTDPATKRPVRPIEPDKTDTSYTLMHGNEVIEYGIDADTSTALRKNIIPYKLNAKVKGYPNFDTPLEEVLDIPVRTQGTGLAAGSASPVNTPTVGAPAVSGANINDNIVAQKKAQYSSAAGNTQIVNQGRSIAAQTARQNVAVPSYINTPQSTPTPIGTPALTQPIVSAPSIGTVQEGEKRLSEAFGGAHVSLNTSIKVPQTTPEVIARINAIPALKDVPALFKGMAAVESAGLVNAKSYKKDGTVEGAGLFQFLEGTAKDLGLSADDRYDAAKVTPAIAAYYTRLYNSTETALNKTLNNRGIPAQVDPRMVLAANNGGISWIQRGINAGHTTWDSMKQYLNENKSPEAGKINTEYVDKVITATIPFIKGGNASDDGMLRNWQNFGIITVNG